MNDTTNLAHALPDFAALTKTLGTPDATFDAWRDATADKHWKHFDLSALRIGYELGKAVHDVKKFTPGPWRVTAEAPDEDGEPAYFAVSDAEGYEIANTANGNFPTPIEQAHAALIAAAPELYEAGDSLLAIVEAAIAAGDWKVDGACDPDIAIGRMCTALAKAVQP